MPGAVEVTSAAWSGVGGGGSPGRLLGRRDPARLGAAEHFLAVEFLGQQGVNRFGVFDGGEILGQAVRIEIVQFEEDSGKFPPCCNKVVVLEKAIFLTQHLADLLEHRRAKAANPRPRDVEGLLTDRGGLVQFEVDVQMEEPSPKRTERPLDGHSGQLKRVGLAEEQQSGGQLPRRVHFQFGGRGEKKERFALDYVALIVRDPQPQSAQAAVPFDDTAEDSPRDQEGGWIDGAEPAARWADRSVRARGSWRPWRRRSCEEKGHRGSNAEDTTITAESGHYRVRRGESVRERRNPFAARRRGERR